MRIRYLDVPGDLPELVRFLPDLYESNFPGFAATPEFLARKRAQLRDSARDPGQVVLVAEDAEGIWGFIWLIIEVDTSGRHRGEVAAIHVDGSRRGQGLGRQLMDEGESILRGYGCERVHLMVTTTNEVAVNLYRDRGYHVTRYQMEKPLRSDSRSDD